MDTVKGITRKSVLIECLELMREKWKLCSKKYDTLEPKKGMEELWMEQGVKCRLLQDMIQAYESPQVRRALANWQQEVIKEDAEGKPHAMNI